MYLQGTDCATITLFISKLNCLEHAMEQQMQSYTAHDVMLVHLFSFPYDFWATLACRIVTVQSCLSLR